MTSFFVEPLWLTSWGNRAVNLGLNFSMVGFQEELSSSLFFRWLQDTYPSGLNGVSFDKAYAEYRSETPTDKFVKRLELQKTKAHSVW